MKLFGHDVSADVTSGSNTDITSGLSILLQPLDVGGNFNAVSAGNLTANGTVDGSAGLMSHSGISGVLTIAEDLTHLRAMGTISGNFAAADNIYWVVTWDDMAAFLTAGGSCSTGDSDPWDGCGIISHVRAWNDITGGLTAEHSIVAVRLETDHSGVYAGQTVAPVGGLNAPLIGLVKEYDRSLFVDLPGTPVVPDGELTAITAEAYARLLDMADELEIAETEVIAIIGAIQGEINIQLAGIAKAEDEAEDVKDATLADIQAEAQLALTRAQAQADRVLEIAQVNSAGAKIMAAAAKQVADAKVQREVNSAKDEATARATANATEVQAVMDMADRARTSQGKHEAAVMFQFNGILLERDKMFVGVFLGEVEDLAFASIHNALDACGIAAEFTGVGTPISMICDGLNAGLYAARGKWGEAVASTVAIIPFIGTFAKHGVKVGKPAMKTGFRRLSGLLGGEVAEAGVRGAFKYVGKGPIGKAAHVLNCIVLRRGRFVAGTPMVMSPTRAEGRWLVTGAGVLTAGVLAYGYTQRPNNKKREEEERDAFFGGEELDTLDDPLDNEWDENHVGLDFMDLKQEQFDKLCDQLFHGDDRDWFEESAVARLDEPPPPSPHAPREESGAAKTTGNSFTASSREKLTSRDRGQALLSGFQ